MRLAFAIMGILLLIALWPWLYELVGKIFIWLLFAGIIHSLPNW